MVLARRFCVLAVLLLALVAPATAAPRIVVHSLTLRGVQHLDPSAIKAALATQASSRLPWGRKGYFDRAQFEADLQRIVAFYVDHGFPDARVASLDVKLNPAQDRVDLRVDVSEGEPLRVAALSFKGFDDLSSADRQALADRAPLKQDSPLQRTAVEATRETATNVLKDHGYAYARVTAREQPTADPHRVTVEFTADPGAKTYFGEIAIVGNKSVDDRIVRRALLYRPGELFRRSVLQQSQRRLYDLELFRFATIQVQPPGQDPAAVPTRVVVAEGKPRRVAFSVGYGTEEKARGEVQWHHYNFMGGARTAGVNAKWSSLDRGVRMEFNQPYLFSPRYSLGLEAHRWYDNEPSFRLTSSGARLTVNYRDQRYFNWSLGYVNEYEESRISQAALNDPSLRNDLIALGLDPQSGSQNGTLSAVSLELQRSSANSPVNATTGSFVSAHVEQAAHVLTGTFAYTNFSIEARHFVSIGSRIVMAGRVKYGAIRPFGNRVSEVPFFKRYFLGGSDSLRGWGRYEVSPLSGSGVPIGGLTMVEGTTEVRFAVAGSLGAVAFLDAGNVWAEAWHVELGTLRYDVGPGLRYQTPIGPIRVDVGYQLNPLPNLLVNGSPQTRRWRIHFSIGQAF